MSLIWSAHLIVPNDDFDGAPLLRKEFALADGHGQVVRATLHATAHGVFEAFSTGSRCRRRAQPGLEQLRVAAALPQLRRDRRCCAPASVLGVALGNGWYRGRLGWTGRRRLLRRPSCGASPSSRSSFADGHRQIVVTDESWTAGPSAVLANDLYDGQTHRRAAARRRLAAAGFAPPELDRRARGRWTSTRRARRRTSARRSSRQEELAPARGLDVAGGQDARRLRPEPRRLAAASPSAARRARDHRPARGGARGRRARRPAAAHRAGDRPVRAQRRRRRRSSRRSPSTASATPRSPAGRATLRADGRSLEAVVVHSDLRRTGDFECSDPLLNQLHRNVVWGTARQLPRRPHRLPAARRAARLDRRPRRVRADGGVPLRRRAASSRDWLVDLDLEQRRRRRHGAVRGARRPEVQPHPTEFPRAGHARRSGATRPSGCRGRCGRRTATVAVLARQYPLDGRARASGRVDAVAERAVGQRVPVRRLARPGRAAGRAVARPRPTPASSRPPASTARRDSLAEAAALLGRTTTPRVRGAGRPDPRGVQRALRHRRTGRSAATHRPSTRSRSSSACSTHGAGSAGRRPAGRAGRRERLPDLHRLRRHAVHQRRADPDRSPRRRLPRCCCSGSARRGSTR